MNLENISYINYRNFNRKNIKLCKKTFIYGNNGTGKSNIVESLHLFSNFKSFRNKCKNNDFINSSDNKCSISMNTLFESYLMEIEKNKKIYINNIECNAIEFLSKNKYVFFITDEINFFSSSNSEKRKYLDRMIFSYNINYINIMKSYYKILKNRNSSLKNKQIDEIDIWTNFLKKYDKIIFNFKIEYINEINKYISCLYNDIFCEKLNIKLVIQNYKEFEKKILYKEIKEKRTLFGHHLSNIEFLINDNIVDNYLSNGQKKKLLFAFKITHNNIFNNKFNYYPLFVIDDLASDLDNLSIDKIIEYIDNIDYNIIITNVNKIETKNFYYVKL